MQIKHFRERKSDWNDATFLPLHKARRKKRCCEVIQGAKYRSAYNNFISDNGVRLGIDTIMLKRLLPCVKFNLYQKQDTVTYTYTIREFKGSEFLNRNRYLSEYIFYKNKLYQFGFGNIYTIPRYGLR